jgi:predicted amidohydrolase
MVIDPLGKITAKASDSNEEIVKAEFHREQVIEARRRFPLFRDRRPDAYCAISTSTEDLHR